LLLTETGRASEAQDGFARALAVLRKQGDRASEAAVLINLGLALEELGRHQQAVSVLRQAVQLALETATPSNLALARLNMVGNLKALGRRQEALDELAAAEALVGPQSPAVLHAALGRMRQLMGHDRA